MNEQAVKIKNSSYFILPLKINDFSKLLAFLRSEKNKWTLEPDGFKTKYLMFYAGKMNEDGDDRFQMYRYAEPEKLHIYMFEDKFSDSGKIPILGDISFYVFGKEIGFLEFQVFYGDMSDGDIAKFVYSFRSLRNPKTLPEESDCKRLKEAAEDILPAENSGTKLCFSNPSEVKMQANVYTMLGIDDLSDDESKSICCRIAHGYRTVSTSDGDAESDYDKCLHLNTEEYWSICPDGIAYINNYSKKRYSPYTYENLRIDFHFMYLLLLNQRFAAISFIEAISECSRNEKARKGITDVYRRVVELRTRYSFRVISDDFFVQTVYSTGYQVLEIDALLKDLEDANGQFNELSKERETRVEHFVMAVTLLALVSAFADLATFLGFFKWHQPHWWSLGILLIAIIIILLLIFKPLKRRQ